MTVQSDAQSLSPSALVALYTLDLSKQGGGLLRFTPGPLDGGNVSFGGVVYQPLPIEETGMYWDGAGPAPTPTLRMSNVTNALSALIIAWDHLRGATVTRVETLRDYLDGQPQANPAAILSQESFVVVRKSAHTSTMAEWELGAPTDVDGKSIPKRQIMKICDHRYRRWAGTGWDYSDATCPYRGGPMFDETGAAVTDPAKDVPSKQLMSCCQRRFGQGAVLPFGGCPGVGVVRGG